MSNGQIMDMICDLMIKSIELMFKALGYLISLIFHSSSKAIRKSNKKHNNEKKNAEVATLIEINALSNLHLLGAERQPNEGTYQYSQRRRLVIDYVNDKINMDLAS